MIPRPVAERATARALRRVRIVHTIIWAVFASAILAIPVVTWRGDLWWALGLSLLVGVEVLVLLLNGMRCPLRAVAARYTDSRADGFDIFIPAWLARNNKLIFGALFAIDEVYLLWRSVGR